MELFKQDLRSVLIADKEGIPIQKLNQEYSALTGQHIEYDQQLYPTLRDFLLTLPDACKIIEYDSHTSFYII